MSPPIFLYSQEDEAGLGPELVAGQRQYILASSFDGSHQMAPPGKWSEEF
jgi:hypothetical protein